MEYTNKDYGSVYLVTATSATKPNYFGHARGRKYHLSFGKNRKSKTICNLLVDKVIKDSHIRSECKVCFSKLKKSAMKPIKAYAIYNNFADSIQTKPFNTIFFNKKELVQCFYYLEALLPGTYQMISVLITPLTNERKSNERRPNIPKRRN